MRPCGEAPPPPPGCSPGNGAPFAGLVRLPAFGPVRPVAAQPQLCPPPHTHARTHTHARPRSTITAIYPNPPLLAAAAEAVTALLRAPSHNLKYVGLDALAGITRVSPKYALEHQVGLHTHTHTHTHMLP